MDNVLLDSNVIIWLHETGKFKSLIKNHKILITDIIVEQANYYISSYGQKVYIDLNKFAIENELTIIEDAPAEELSELVKRIKNSYLPEIHPGEISCIQLIIKNQKYKFCTGDTQAMVVMGGLSLRNQAVSLEELLGTVKGIPPKFTKKILNSKIREGEIKKIQNGEAG